jgi:hypothetical protein
VKRPFGWLLYGKGDWLFLVASRRLITTSSTLSSYRQRRDHVVSEWVFKFTGLRTGAAEAAQVDTGFSQRECQRW